MKYFLFLSFSLVMSFSAIGQQYVQVGEVIDVHDGDTYLVRKLCDNTVFYVQLMACDAPEIFSPINEAEHYGSEAKAFAALSLIGQTAIVVSYGRMDGNELIAQVFIGADDFALTMLRNGYGRYKGTSKLHAIIRKLYRAAMEAARNSQLGMWSINNKQ